MSLGGLRKIGNIFNLQKNKRQVNKVNYYCRNSSCPLKEDCARYNPNGKNDFARYLEYKTTKDGIYVTCAKHVIKRRIINIRRN